MKKKIFLALAACALLLAACGEDDYVSSKKKPGGGGGTDPGETEVVPKTEGKLAIAYVTYYGTAIPDPKVITHIHYAFAEPYLRAGVYEGFKLQGSEARFQRIVDLKKTNPNLKISLSLTNTIENADNPRGGGFSLLAKSDAYRKAFAADCKAFLIKWGIDGIDMDWEFPGLSWSGETGAYDRAVDVANHVLLMRQLRETLGDKYYLTYAGYCMDKTTVSGGSQYIDIKAVAPYVDFVNIMTYDLDEAPHHQSALKDATAYSDCTRAVDAYLKAGMPANKLVLGIPFYGRRSFASAPLAINYNKILTLGAGYKIDNWDSAASVPYVTYNGQYYCGYDNAQSIALKGAWLLEKGMLGMMYWDYDGDDAAGTLRTAVWNAVMKK
jgi:chitinase